MTGLSLILQISLAGVLCVIAALSLQLIVLGYIRLFRPAPRVRTFGQLMGHVAQEQYLFFCGPVKGEKKAADIERTKTTKSDLLAALKESFDYCDAVYNGMTDASAREIVDIGGARNMKLRLLWMNVVHDQSHYGNIVTYLRIKGIVPPSTEGQ